MHKGQFKLYIFDNFRSQLLEMHHTFEIKGNLWYNLYSQRINNHTVPYLGIRYTYT